MIVQSKRFPVPGCADAVHFQRSLQKIGIPRPIRDRLVVAIKRAAGPDEETRRKRTAREIGPRMALPQGVDAERFASDGYTLLEPSAIASARPAARALDELFERLRKQARVGIDPDARKGQFLIKVAANEELLAIPEVRAFVLGEKVISLATDYFGEVPVLSGTGLMWSPPNELCEESQLYHYDGEDSSQLKVFLAVKEVDEYCGPFTFLPAQESARLVRTKRHSARLADEMVEGIAGSDAVIRVVGPPGTVAAVDTSRCMHYGSRGNSRERLVLFTQFTRYLAPKAPMHRWRIDEADLAGSGTNGEDLARLRRLVLNLA